MIATVLFYTGLSAIATSCSFVGAVIFYVVDTLHKRKERERHQASLVDVWLSRAERVGDNANVYARVSNRSDGTIRFVLFWVLNNFAVPMSNPASMQIISPNAIGESHGIFVGQVVLPMEIRGWADRDLIGFFKLEMTFADSSGLSWRRNYQGRLSREDGTKS